MNFIAESSTPLPIYFCLLLGAAVAGPTDVVRPELATSLGPAVELEAGWRDPPPLARTRCWWWWLNGNVTKQAITRDLEEMKAKGLGGATIIDAGGADQRGHRQVPHGPDFASPEWRELFLHALAEADRLGLELGWNIQSGWNLGGPTVRPEHAAKKLTWSESTVRGGQRVDLQLDEPPTVGDFYRDVAVVAVPGSTELARIDNFRQKAYYDYPGPFTAAKADHLLDVGSGDRPEHVIDANDVVDLTHNLDRQGRLRWDAPAGGWRILRFGYTLTGSRVSTHSEGWDGWAIDYLDREAFDQYWRDVIAPLVEAARPFVGRSLKYMSTDSWELGPVNWTPQMPVQFERLRGYQLTRFLPALAGYVVDDRGVSNRFLNDFRRTLADLIAEGKYATFRQYAHELGVAVHPESGGPHAAPIDALKCLGRNDIPMGEFWSRSRTHRVHDHERLFIKQPASAAHVYGKRIVYAEAFTSIGPQWEKSPRDLKPVFDRVACEGLNLVALHTFDCSPAEMGMPGQAYFAGTHVNPNVTWWRHAGVFFGYLNRCQFLLQQGLPAADVLYFYGENVPSFVRLKDDDPAGVLPGFDYDVINAEALVERTSIRAGRIVLPDGTTYRLLVLPSTASYGLPVLEHIASLVEAGAMVIGPKPVSIMGLPRSPGDAERFSALADRLWQANGSPGANRIVDQPARQALGELSVGPDFETVAGGDVPPHIDYFHRRTDEADIYFLVNRRADWQDAHCSLRITGKQPELWTPMTGEIGDATAFRQEAGRTIVPLRFPPEGSLFVVFRREIAPTARGAGEWNGPRPAVTNTLAGPWRVQFDPAWGGPAEPVEFDALESWSRHADEGVKYYSGSAVYRTTFEVDDDPLHDPARRWWIDLGQVKELAAVTINGEKVGTAWTEPFRVEVTSHLRSGENRLEVEVTNLWPNRLIGDRRLPPDERLTRTNIRKFRRDSPLLESGLLGPVRLMRE